MLTRRIYPERAMPDFIHLRVHSEYSIVDGIVTIDALIEAVAKAKMPAVALTDQHNLFAAVKFYKAAQEAGIKPILGIDLYLHNPVRPAQPYRLTLLCQNQKGFRNLTRLVSRAYLEGQQHGFPALEKKWLSDFTDGLIALSGCKEGDIGQALLNKNVQQAEQLLSEWQNLFPDRFYLELQRNGKPQEEIYTQAALQLALKYHAPVVATNDVRFISEDDFEAHEARVCIYDGHVLNDPRRPRHYTAQQYLRSSQEMQQLFADIPEALQNTIEIAKRCSLSLQLGKNFLPHFPVPTGYSVEKYLSEQAKLGLQQRFKETKIVDQEKYISRLQIELNVINPMGFAGYFLIVADFIQWAKQRYIPVGPGRGSGAGSLVAYALRITDIDPIPYDLLFERFLNPERISMPDFDIDFCMDNRDRVIEYVSEKYGRDSVSQIITYGSMAAKAVVRDVGRVFGHPYGFVDKIAKLIPFELGMTLDKALQQEPELRERYQKEEEVKALIDLAKKLEGLTRNASKHAGGVVISPTVLTDFTPIYCEPDRSNLVSQFDKDDVEAVGLVKFDFLGLRTLTIIAGAVDNINAKRKKINESPLDILQIPLDDSKTFALIKACTVTAVFQIESRGMRDLVNRLQPDQFEDLISLVALFRPGPLQSGMVDDFINRRHGRAKVEYLHPTLEPILRPTYGIIVYQEQVMKIAQDLAGYTLGAADLLRRAMGKKKAGEMAKHRQIFIKGAQERGISVNTATAIFDLMEEFADYGFNKSHSAAYALITYQTAWLKAHYPAEFMAAVLSSDMDNTDKVVNFLQECRQLQLCVIPPDINRSEYKFIVTEKGEILYGLGAIKGAGEAAISGILAERSQYGLFKDLFDFCRRIDARKVNRRVLEALIKSGAFDSFGLHRAGLLINLDNALQTAEQQQDNGQQDLFGLNSVEHRLEIIEIPPWPAQQILQGEKETLGYYHSGHPLQFYENELKQVVSQSIAALTAGQEQSVTIAGLVTSLRTRFTKRGSRMAFLVLEDRTGTIELTIFSELLDTHKSIIAEDAILIVEGDISVDDYTGNNKLVARNLYSIEQLRERYAKGLLVQLQHSQLSFNDIEQLAKILSPFKPGKCPIYIHYAHTKANARLQLGQDWRVNLDEKLIQQLREIFGDQQVKVCY
jgi:DNA polymerase-3 subunit alpha